LAIKEIVQKFSRLVKHSIKSEKGYVFLLALALLAFVTITVTPLLAFMNTGLGAGQVYQQETDLLYAADASVEDAIFKIKNNDSELPNPNRNPPIIIIRGTTL